MMEKINNVHMGEIKSINKKRLTKKSIIVIVIAAILCTIGFIALCVFMGQREENKDEYFLKMFDKSERQIVEKAFSNATVTMENDAESHLHVLFEAIWYYGSEDIEITEAEIIPFSNEDASARLKDLRLDGYALRVVDESGNVYIVWKANYFERVILNENEEILFRIYGPSIM